MLLPTKRIPFTLQKVAFYLPKGALLKTNTARFGQQKIPYNVCKMYL